MMAGTQRRIETLQPMDEATAFASVAGACASIVQAGKASPEAVAIVTAALLHDVATHDAPITAAEARCLIDTNDAVAFARNCSEWRALYARAIGNHLAARSGIDASDLGRAHWIDPQEEVPSAVPQEAEASSAAWLIRQVARTQNVSPAEQALLVLLDQRLPGLARKLAG